MASARVSGAKKVLKTSDKHHKTARNGWFEGCCPGGSPAQRPTVSSGAGGQGTGLLGAFCVAS